MPLLLAVWTKIKAEKFSAGAYGLDFFGESE